MVSFNQYPPSKRAKKYKRFSSSRVSTKSAGPSTATVFPGGRLIPDSAKGGFDYRHRGTSLGLTEEQIIEKVRAHKHALKFFGFPTGDWAKADEDAYWAMLKLRWSKEVKADPKLLAELREAEMSQPNEFPAFDELEGLMVLWQSEFRQRIHYWNYISLPVNHRKPNNQDFIRMFFSGKQYVFVEREGLIYRRSAMYKDHDLAMGAYHCKMILWRVPDPVPLLTPPMPQSGTGSPVDSP